MRNLFIEIWFANKSTQIQYGKDLLFISRLYSRFISDVEIVNLRKISIEIIDFSNKSHIIPTHKLTKVCVLYKYLDYSILNNIKQESIKCMFFLDFLLESIMELAEIFDWPKEKFKEAYNMVIETKFKNEFVLLSQKLSNDKRYGASIIVNNNQEYVSFILELKDNKLSDETRKIEFLRIVYYTDEFSNIIHKFKWVNNEELIISNKEGEINFKFSVHKGFSEIFLAPKVHDEKFLLDELKLLNSDTSKEERFEINNKRIANHSSMQEE